MKGARLTQGLTQKQVADALKVKGVECDYTILPGMGHGFGQKQYLATIAFFETHLKTKNANVETHK